MSRQPKSTRPGASSAFPNTLAATPIAGDQHRRVGHPHQRLMPGWDVAPEAGPRRGEHMPCEAGRGLVTSGGRSGRRRISHRTYFSHRGADDDTRTAAGESEGRSATALQRVAVSPLTPTIGGDASNDDSRVERAKEQDPGLPFARA